MQSIMGKGKSQFDLLTQPKRALQEPSNSNQPAQADTGFSINSDATNRFPSSYASSATVSDVPVDIASMYGIAEYPGYAESKDSSATQLPSFLSENNQEKPTIPALAQISNRSVLPGVMGQLNNTNVVPRTDNVPEVEMDNAAAHTQVWSQNINQEAQGIDVDYLTSTPMKVTLPVNQLKAEWEQGEFDSLSTTDSDAFQGESVYLPWREGARTAPGDWKVFANHVISKFGAGEQGEDNKVLADLNKPFSYNFDNQKASVGAIQESLHSKQFSVEEAEQAWNDGDWDTKLLSKPDNHHAEEVVGLPWGNNNDESVHILTWWRFLNELGGYQNPQ